ncbi:MAG: N-acetyl-alpha-D-glucosaminyl L-malate synthase BshA [bacterium]|nr:N-acetyl-alpha-D-glucosaminyl L-malate synthase BshA [bacterium]
MSRLPVIGITCYPTQGGSGVVASELGLNLARRGYEVHFITSEMPLRLRRYEANIYFHPVEAVTYPVFQHTPYTLALATKMSEVARRHGLDLLHVHYAIPHAASAYLARAMIGPQRLKVITTLHGTDITLVGQEPSYFEMTRFLIDESDAVTAVSGWLRDETVRVFGPRREVEVIPNFVDPQRFRPRDDGPRALFAAPDEKIIVHASNFRPVKNATHVVRVFAQIAQRVPSRLLLVGEGPERSLCEQLAVELGVADRVRCLGQVENLEEILALSDLCLLPSRHESFGLVALEAMACGTPVVATDRGGTSEFIERGLTGFLCDPDDIAGMAAVSIDLLQDPELHRQIRDDGLREAVSRFGTPCILKRYVDLYDRVLG